MQRDRLITWSAAVAVCLSLFVSHDARAGWPMARHDARRTGTATGQSNITIPVANWRYYLGGSIRSDNLQIFDVDGDGVGEVVVVTGGRAIAKELTDETRWETAPLELLAMDGFVDLDGDSKVELVAHSQRQAFVISPADGSVLWSESFGEMGTIGGVRIGDLTGDGLAELAIGECGCCRTKSGIPGVVYSFAGGFASPSLIWTFPFGSCGGTSGAFSLVSLDGNPGEQVILGQEDHLSVVDGATGAVIAASPVLGSARIQRSQCIGVNLDDSPGDEVFCLLNGSDPPTATNRRRAFALHFHPGPTPSFDLLWSTTLAPDGGDLKWLDPVVDLDADGRFEVVASGKALDGTWTTKVLAAETGAILTTIPDSITRGVADTLPGGGAILLTTSDTGLTAWRIARTSTPIATQLWTIPDADILPEQDQAAMAQSLLATHVLTADINGDGTPELLVRSRSEPVTLTTYTTTTTAASPLAQFALSDGRDVVSAWAMDPAKGLGLLAVLQDDGLVTLLNEGFAPTASADDVHPAGLRFGGYYITGAWRKLQSTLVAGKLEPGQPDAVIARDSRGALVRLDAATASWAAPPRIVWTREHAFSPAIIDNLAGNQPGVVCFRLAQPVTTDPDYVISVLNADGSTRWSVGAPRRPFNDILPGRFNGDSVSDLVFEWGSPGDTLLVKRAVSGATGATLWDSTPIPAGSGRQPAGIAVGQWNADGLDDVYHQTGATRVISGADGTELVHSSPGADYFQPILSNLDGDPRDEVTLQGGAAPASVLDDGLKATLWQSADNDRPFPYGSLVTCPDGAKLLVEGSQRNPARLKTVTLSGSAVGTVKTVVLAGGQAYPDETRALSEGKMLSQLGSVAAHADLRGVGQPVVVAGSGDGWLYAYQPCTATLEFVYRVGSPVGSPTFADTDGDGNDEILVSAGDGYLYDLSDLAIASPGYVWDTDPDRGITDRDVNTITTRDHLSARWRDVPGALSYEIAIVTLQGEYVTDPMWVDVGNVVETTATNLPLTDGGVYRFAVRAVGSEGRSVDQVSDGVVVRFPAAGDAGPGADAGTGAATTGGCGCDAQSGSGGPAGTTSLLVLVLWAGVLRRSRAV